MLSFDSSMDPEESMSPPIALIFSKALLIASFLSYSSSIEA